ncbi:hypothetical protein BT96DRAFT_591204 [Gymnopus androsaceus JB14]|uniref:Uncharacterized protein n=1 Tax=Gymnopus androsaceus JB14 TaxID=1447944 RepID=A0A6A4II56_9AGAR|nr:hypothetical protein BT96DRAFT_591204 [Gymnopus androsaceus JB14]
MLGLVYSFYCIILLATLFISTCYWSPISLDSALSEPWADNITTFGEALSFTLGPSYSKPLPTVFQPADRCWCDISTDGFFEPFSTSQWERLSVQKLKDSLERQKKIEERIKQEVAAENDTLAYAESPEPTAKHNSSSIVNGIWSLLKSQSLQWPTPSPLAEQDARNSSEAEAEAEPSYRPFTSSSLPERI